MTAGDLQPPPASLHRFPRLPDRRRPHQLFRIFHARNRLTGRVNSPWNYRSVPPGGGRFDLPAPHGTCYWSDRRYGAWVEVFRGVRVFDLADARTRRLFVGTPASLDVADLCAPAAYRFGVTAELCTTPDYDIPQQWAAALYRAGVEGVHALVRHDPSASARTFAVFGPAGAAARRVGWHTVRTRIEQDTVLLRELAALGVRGAAVPHTVPITRP